TAAVVFVGAIVISQQVKLFFSKDLGFDKEYAIYAPVPRDWTKAGVQKMETIRNQFAAMPEVRSATMGWEVPDGRNGGQPQVYRMEADSTTAISSQALSTDNQFATTWAIPMKAGSFFKPVYLPGDSANVVINETQAAALGYKDPADAVHRQLRVQ